MKWIVLLLLTPLLLHAADDATGDWSKPVKGLRARLFISQSHEPEFDKTYDVSIEFENVGVVGNLGTIKEEKTFQYIESDLALEVTDANNQKLPHRGPSDGEEFVPWWNLCLPPGGKLSFPIGCGGANPPRYLTGSPAPAAVPAGKYLKITSSLGWLISSDGPGVYYLSGAFTTKTKDAQPQAPPGMHPTLRDSGIRLNWEGTLELPPVKVSAN